MNFNIMGFLIGREMAKKELGSGKDDRANQLGLVGAMTPDPMMGAVYAMMLARNEAPSSTGVTVTQPLTGGTTQAQLRMPPIKIFVDNSEHPADKVLDFGNQAIGLIAVDKTIRIENTSNARIYVSTEVEGDQFVPDRDLNDDPLRARNGHAELKIAYKPDPVGSPHEGVLWISVEDYDDYSLSLKGATLAPHMEAKFGTDDWVSQPVIRTFAANNDEQTVTVTNKGLATLEFEISDTSTTEGYEITLVADGSPVVPGTPIKIDSNQNKAIKVKRIDGQKKVPASFLLVETNDIDHPLLVAILKTT